MFERNWHDKFQSDLNWLWSSKECHDNVHHHTVFTFHAVIKFCEVVEEEWWAASHLSHFIHKEAATWWDVVIGRGDTDVTLSGKDMDATIVGEVKEDWMEWDVTSVNVGKGQEHSAAGTPVRTITDGRKLPWKDTGKATPREYQAEKPMWVVQRLKREQLAQLVLMV